MKKTNNDNGVSARLADFPHTDLGNAKRLVARYGHILRHCGKWNRWLVWDGKRWCIDQSGEVERRAKATALAIRDEAKYCAEDYAQHVIRHCNRSQSAGAIAAMIQLARTESEIPVLPQDLDAIPMLLNCANGTVDLMTGELRQHDPENLLTKMIEIDYSPDAKAPTWSAFLSKITNGNRDYMAYLQKVIGYALTGTVKEKAIFILYGSGNTGKTTKLEAIRFVLGDYAGQIPIDSLLKKPNSGIPNDIAQLQGKRFITCSEAPAGRGLDEAKVKYLTGGGNVQARPLYGEYFEFDPTFKIFIDSNYKPSINADDGAMWNRIKLLPFTEVIPVTEIDKNLRHKLQMEAAGILAWAVQGCLDWQSTGLHEPDVVRQATSDYQRDCVPLSDSVQNFILSSCERGFEFVESTGDLYNAYAAWCYTNGQTALGKEVFGKRLKDQPGLSPSKKQGDRGWKGIRLVQESKALLLN